MSGGGGGEGGGRLRPTNHYTIKNGQEVSACSNQFFQYTHAYEQRSASKTWLLMRMEAWPKLPFFFLGNVFRAEKSEKRTKQCVLIATTEAVCEKCESRIERRPLSRR